MFADAIIDPRIDVAAAGPASAIINISCSVFAPDGGNNLGSSWATVELAPGAWARVAPPPISLVGAELWFPAQTPSSPDRAIYTLMTVLTSGGTVVDVVNVTFGIRNASFSASSGLWINGFPTKIRGLAIHQDFGPTGTFVPPNLHAFRVQVRSLQRCGWCCDMRAFAILA